MSEVVIVGVGQTPVGEHWEVSLRSLAAKAMLAAVRDAGGLRPQAVYIGSTLSASLSRQANLGSLLVDNAGLDGVEGVTVEAGGASGAAALRAAYLAVRSGWVNIALVIGVEKYTDGVGSEVESAVAQTLDSDYEAMVGMTPTAQAGLLMQRYLHEYSVDRSALGAFSVLAHANAARNPNAYFRKPISAETYAKAEMVSDPMNLLDMAPYADGAAALLVASSDSVPAEIPHPLVRITGSSSVTDTLALHDRPDPLAWLAAGFSVERACRQAGILPTDVDIYEYFDAFSIYAALSLEAAGLARRGEGWKSVRDGAVMTGGKNSEPRRIAFASMGGLKGRGNPIGATGVYQAAEAALQLRGQAGAAQVPGAQRALVQALGGPASTAVTHVLERMGRLEGF
jgi:acetyl-CoA C-acetyltransferase